jgi:hypothetical protein
MLLQSKFQIFLKIRIIKIINRHKILKDKRVLKLKHSNGNGHQMLLLDLENAVNMNLGKVP